ncbi:50S ribosomal protein L6 [candidate division KSB1 bacterium]|nr:50S ribosomal protein L6 [candidate division KSB1 bacterium]
MSRVGKAPIPIPDDVKVEIADNRVTATGPKGQLSVKVNENLKIIFEEGAIRVERPNDEKLNRSLHGLSRSLIANIVEGVTRGFEKRLEIIGVGYRAEMRSKNLLLNVGYSHPIVFIPPEEIQIAVEGNNIIVVKGIHKELVGQVAAKIRSFKKPEPYKGKGIRYAGEYVRKKAGKTAA